MTTTKTMMNLSDGSVSVSFKTGEGAGCWITWPGGGVRGETWQEAAGALAAAGFYDKPSRSDVMERMRDPLAKAAMFLSCAEPLKGQRFRHCSHRAGEDRFEGESGEIVVEVDAITRSSFTLYVSMAVLDRPFLRQLTPPPDGDRGKFLSSLGEILAKDLSDAIGAAVDSHVQSFERISKCMDAILQS